MLVKNNYQESMQEIRLRKSSQNEKFEKSFDDESSIRCRTI